MLKQYFKLCLKELDKDLRKFGREEKLKYIGAYKYSLEFSFHKNYPDRFSFPAPNTTMSDMPKEACERADYVAQQFGPLEVESAREFLLTEIEKRKNKFSKPSFVEQLRRLLVLLRSKDK